MTINDISIYLETLEFDINLNSEFQFSTRYIFNYLRRYIKMKKIQSNTFNKICLKGTRNKNAPLYYFEKNVVIPFYFDESEYNLMTDNLQKKYIFTVINNCLISNKDELQIAVESILKELEIFINENKENNWEYSHVKKNDIEAQLICLMNKSNFALKLIVKKNTKIIFEKDILETKPDETCFSYRFKELIIDGNNIIVKDKFGKTVYECEINA